jgi:hypothetical protein
MPRVWLGSRVWNQDRERMAGQRYAGERSKAPRIRRISAERWCPVRAVAAAAVACPIFAGTDEVQNARGALSGASRS